MMEISSQSNSSSLAKNLAKVVSQHAKPIHNDLFTCMEESVRNVIDWANEPGFALAQTQQRAGGERAYNIAIVDYGRGIQATLSLNPTYAGVGEREALEMAVKERVTAATSGLGDNFGIGLYVY